jgi:uncharacterized surface anchored protein
MATKKALAVLSLAMLLLSGIPASASAQTAGDDVVVGGQVTINNVDETDNSIKLNGAQVKIVNKSSGEELIDEIAYNGSLVYELVLGDYTVIQLSPPDGYELNTRVYEFSLSIPEETNPNTVRIVNAYVNMTNRSLDAAAEPVTETPEETEQPAPIATDPPKEDIVEATPVPPISKNPETADFSIFFIVAAFLGIAGLTCSAAMMNKAKRHQR